MTERGTLGLHNSFPVSRHASQEPRWSTYLQEFHAARPGITEDVLATTTNGTVDPYAWLVEALPPRGPVLDLACGSGPMASAIGADRWVGIDRSPEELGRAEAHSGRLVRGDAVPLPFTDGAFSAVVCSMALMLLQPVDQVLLEIRRVLVPGGLAEFMVPGSRPLTAKDLYRYGRLMVAARKTHLAYPNDRQLRRLDALLISSDLHLVSDERVRFAYLLSDIEASTRFIDSLYLPGTSQLLADHAAQVSERWVGSELGVPLRRIVVRAR